MEQKDYLLREIEKIGILLHALFNSITGKGGSYALTMEKQFEEEKGMLLGECGLDLDVFLSLEVSETEQYISKFKGFNGSNIELLADILKETGMKTQTETSKEYLQKALRLYELCNTIDNTFSIERADKIGEIKNAI
jgi:hypothetical protein